MKNGAPGEIRTPGLLVRSRCFSQNSRFTATAVSHHELPLTTSLSPCSSSSIAIRGSSSGLLVGTKLGTICEADFVTEVKKCGEFLASFGDVPMRSKRHKTLQPRVSVPRPTRLYFCTSMVCGSLTAISGALRYSVIVPVTQICLSRYFSSGVPNLSRFSPHMRTVKTWLG